MSLHAMFFIDDILLSPVKGFMWLMQELQNAVDREQENEGDRLTAQLSSLYMLLETNQITQEQFDEQERAILDRLDELAAAQEPSDDAEADDTALDDEDSLDTEEDIEDTDEDDVESNDEDDFEQDPAASIELGEDIEDQGADPTGPIRVSA